MKYLILGLMIGLFNAFGAWAMAMFVTENGGGFSLIQAVKLTIFIAIVVWIMGMLLDRVLPDKKSKVASDKKEEARN